MSQPARRRSARIRNRISRRKNNAIRRRRFIEGLAISTAAIIGGCSREPMSRESFMDLARRLRGKSSVWLANFEEELDEWFEEHAPSKPRGPLPNEADYAVFLAQLNLRYIQPHEIIRPHRNVRAGVANVLPPRAMWNRIAATLHVADELRNRLGSRLNTINSAYRSPAYNAACPGAAKNSFHTKNRALDLMFACGPKTAFDMAKKLRAEGFFSGGIGLYGSFIHIDTRGYTATWGEKTA